MSEEEIAALKAEAEANKAALAALQAEQAKILAKNQELLDETKAAKTAKREAEEAAAREAEAKAAKSGDVDALKASWEQKHAKTVQDSQSVIDSLKAQVHGLTVGATAAQLAGELAIEGSSDLLRKLLLPRLSVDERDGQPVVQVLDANGKPSALTIDELKNEIRNDKAYAPLIAGSKATGGGAAGGGNGGGAAKKASEYTSDELTNLYRTDKATYDRVVAERNK